MLIKLVIQYYFQKTSENRTPLNREFVSDWRSREKGFGNPVVIKISDPCLSGWRDIAHVKIRNPGTNDIKTTPPPTLFTFIDGRKKKEMKKFGGSEVIKGLNGGICSQQAASTAFSAVILEVYEVCRNRISLYGHGGPLAICSRVDVVPRKCESYQKRQPI